MMEIIILPASGTLPVGLNEFGKILAMDSVSIPYDGVLPMLGNSSENTAANPPKPR